MPSTVLLALFILSVPMFSLLTPNPVVVQAAASMPVDVQINHTVEIRNGGLVLINDTVKLSTSSGESATMQDFAIGFPYAYRSNLDYAFAYEASDPKSMLDVVADTGLGRIGFYGVSVNLPNVDISDGGQYSFTVVFVFSGAISDRTFPVAEQKQTWLNATFPAYPSIGQRASLVNVTLVVPSNVAYMSSSYEERGINFTRLTVGSFQVFNHARSNVDEFSSEDGWFVVSGTGDFFEIIEAAEITREVEFRGLEHILVSDSYWIINGLNELSRLRMQLPKGAYDVSAWEERGPVSSDRLNVEQGNATVPTDVTVQFLSPVASGEEARVTVNFQLPWENYVDSRTWNSFHFSGSAFEGFNWTIRRLTTTIILPEGATLHVSSPPASLSSIQNNAFQETLIFTRYNVTPFQDLSLSLTFQHSVFWESFRHTLWMGAAVVFLGVVVALWRVPRPSAPLPSRIPVRSEDLKAFADAYAQKRRHLRELGLLETRVQKGKISRRRYKVRKTTLDSRVSSLSRDLAALREKIRIAGPRYAEMMRQVEVAETELQAVEANIRRTEIRYKRGEISAGAYHKLLEDAFKRRDRAKTTIDGVLLRLREEVS